MNDLKQLDDKLRALREDFDRSFAVATTETGAEQLDFLRIRIAGDPYALRFSEVASLHADRRLVLAPSPLPELCGIAGFRGVLTPVYDLAAVLGYRGVATKRWLVVAQWPSAIAFAFEAFEMHLRVPVDQISQASDDANGAVHSGGRAVPLLHLPSLVEGIARRIKAPGPTHER